MIEPSKQAKVNTLFDLDKGTNRLDQIYKQVKDLQQMKDDIMGDLDDFMNQVAASDVKLPEQFDEVVDLVVQESRDQAQGIIDIAESGATPEEIQ